MSRNFFRLSVLVALIVGLVSGTARAQVPAFDALYVFGDSLADNGNDFAATQAAGFDPAITPSVSPHRTYFLGRFSNGYVFPEYLWQALSGNAPGSAQGLKAFLTQQLFPLGPAVDFAFGGTGTPFLDQTPGGFWVPGLKGQVELYRHAPQPKKKAKRPLFVIVTGANDYRADQFNVPLSIDTVVGNIVDSIKTLYQTGARDVMVLNLPDLGLVPGAGDPATETALSLAHNAALKTALDTLDAQTPNLRIVQPDLIEAFNQLPAAMNKTIPALEVLFPGNPYPMSACLFINPVLCKDIPPPPSPQFNSPMNMLFWDVVHPTTEAHWYLAQYLVSSLTAYYSH